MGISSLLFNDLLQGENNPSNTYVGKGSATALGGGVFVTAAHTFNILHAHQLSDPSDPASDLYSFTSGYIPLVDQKFSITGVHLDSKFSASVSSPKEVSTVANHDIAYFTDPQAAGLGGLAPMVVFADSSAANQFFTAGMPVDVGGAITSTTGTVRGVTVGEGQFTTQYATATVTGDSGGALSTGINNVPYLIGINNAGNAVSATGLDTYFNTQFYSSAVGHIQSGDSSVQQLPADVIYGLQNGETVKSSQRRASIITNGDTNNVALGAGGGLISTGIGSKDIVVLNDQAIGGGTGSIGSTVVISPGSKTIVGGNSNDRLVLLAHRLSNSSNTTISNTSDTVTLVGGAYLGSVGYGQGVWAGSLAPAASLDSAKGGNTYGAFLTNGDNSTGGQIDASTGAVKVNPSNIAVYGGLGSSADYSATYTLVAGQNNTNNLYVDITGQSWESRIVLENFHDGDYGINFSQTGTTDGIYYQDGNPFLMEEIQAYQQYSSDNGPHSVISGQLDDNPAISWDGQKATAYYVASHDEIVQADAALAQDDPSTTTPSPAQPSLPNLNDAALYDDQSAIVGSTQGGERFGKVPFGSTSPTRVQIGRDGSPVIHVLDGGQTLHSTVNDTFENGGHPDSTFVFEQNHGADIVAGFRLRGTDHDTLSLPSSDFASIAEVLRDTRNTAGGALIVDPATGDTVNLMGINKVQLVANHGDFTLHA